MAEGGGTGTGIGVDLVRASQVAREVEVRRSPNGVRFATYGETGVPAPDLDRMLEAVPAAIAGALKANTYYFVPLALREPEGSDGSELAPRRRGSENSEGAMVAPAYSEDLGDAAICHRNVELDQELGSGQRGVFISTRLMGDRFALSFEFFINVAHAFADEAGVPEPFAELAWTQALANARGETSLDAFEARNLALGRPANWEPAPTHPPAMTRRGRAFSSGAQLANRAYTTDSDANRDLGIDSGGDRQTTLAVVPATASLSAAAESPAAGDPKEREVFLETAFSDALAIYLLSLALDLDYSELRERDYPLLAPGPLADRLRLMAELYPPNPGYDFAVRYRRRA